MMSSKIEYFKVDFPVKYIFIKWKQWNSYTVSGKYVNTMI